MRKYGLTKKDIITSLDRVESANNYLKSHYLENMSGDKIPLIDIYKSPIINPHRYVAEVQNRVWSLNNYAQERNLELVFLTLTLPTEYHKYTLGKDKVTLIKNPKFAHKNVKLFDIYTKERAWGYDSFVFRYLNGLGKNVVMSKKKFVSFKSSDYSVSNGVKMLSNMFKSIKDDRSYKSIPQIDRLYFRVTEPHKSGTPHLHIAIYVPKENVKSLVEAIYRKFPKPQADIKVSYIPDDSNLVEKDLMIKSPIRYILKYIYKSLDDMRDDKGIGELSCWYISNRVSRFYTSRTLISLSIYRPLNGRLSLLELTKYYKDDTLSVLIDSETKKPLVMYLRGNIFYNRKKLVCKQFISKEDEHERQIQFSNPPVVSRGVLPVDIDGILFNLDMDKYFNNGIVNLDKVYSRVKSVDRMGDYELYNYYNSLDIDIVNIHHFGLVKNTLINRGLIDGYIQSLNSFNFNYGFNNE